jgi:hypothetical protein
MLLFKKKFLDLIRRGEKTQTIRIWPHRKMRAGQRSYIPGVGYIRVEAVEEVRLADLNKEDAHRDGFPSVRELRQEIVRLYPQGVGTSRQAYRVVFRVLSERQQRQVIRERERRKMKGAVKP